MICSGSTNTQSLCMLSSFSRVQLFVTLWTISQQAPLSMGFSKQEYWSGLPCPPPGYLPHAGINLVFLMTPALVGSLHHQRHLGSPLSIPFQYCMILHCVYYYSLFTHSSDRYLSCVLLFLFEHSCSCFQRPR